MFVLILFFYYDNFLFPILETKLDESNIDSALDYYNNNDTSVFLTSNHSAVTTRVNQLELKQKTKKEEARFFEQFCKYNMYTIYSIIKYSVILLNITYSTI